jgi:hypothetical protein
LRWGLCPGVTPDAEKEDLCSEGGCTDVVECDWVVIGSSCSLSLASPGFRLFTHDRSDRKTHSRISRLHLWHGGFNSPPSGPVPRMHLAFRCRQLIQALYARLKSSGWVRFLLEPLIPSCALLPSMWSSMAGNSYDGRVMRLAQERCCIANGGYWRE